MIFMTIQILKGFQKIYGNIAAGLKSLLTDISLGILPKLPIIIILLITILPVNT